MRLLSNTVRVVQEAPPAVTNKNNDAGLWSIEKMTQPAKVQQRWTARLPVTLDVALYDPNAKPVGSRPLLMKSRDISVGGMFIETRNPLPLDTHVMLAFGLRLQDERPYYRLPATVVRVAPDGIGVMFNTFDSEMVDSLRRILHRQQSQGVASSV